MARHKNLPIWRDAHRLVDQLHATTRKAPRDLRYTLVQQLISEAVEICVDIADANRATGTHRSDRLANLQRRTTRVDVLLQVAMDQHCISLGAAANAMETLDAVSRQAHGWAKHTNVGHGQPEPAPST